MIARLFLAALITGALVTPARAQDTWRVQLTPCAWVPGISGSIRPASRAPTFHTDLAADDILEDLNGAFDARYCAARSRRLS